MKLLLLILSITLLYSCKTETSKIWRLSNETSEMIQLTLRDAENNTEKTMIIAAKESAIIKQSLSKGSQSTEDEPSAVFSSFIITNSNGNICTKDYTVQSNWFVERESKSPPKKIYFNHQFVVYNSDF